MKNLTFLMVSLYVYGNKISSLSAISKLSPEHETIFSMTGQEANLVLKNMTKISQKIASVGSTAEHPNIFLPNVGNLNVTFDEKAREDAFEKKPATESPYAVLLLIYLEENNKPAGCSGSLLSVDWVLTAAHCLFITNISKVLVYAGGYSHNEVLSERLAEGSQLRSAKSLLPHPKYDSENKDYDIGLVQVNESFKVTDSVRPTKISTQPWDHRGYRECQLTGFGIVQTGEKRADDKVRKTHTLEVKQPCLCSFRLKMILSASIVSRYICVRPRQDYGTCQGDSGGGLLCDGQIRGVAILGVEMEDTITCQVKIFSIPECGSANTLSIFQDSCPFLQWVNSNIRLFNDSQISGECVDRGAAAGWLRGGGPYFLLFAVATFVTQRFLPHV